MPSRVMSRADAEHKIALHRGKIDTLFDQILDPSASPSRRKRAMELVQVETDVIAVLVNRIGKAL